MLYLKKLRLKNFCNFKDHTFSFCKEDGTPFRFICFFGPNGFGKTTLLEAISLLTSDQTGRRENMVRSSLSKYIRSNDYDPTYNALKNNSESEMFLEGIYCDGTSEYVVQLTETGWVRNDFCPISDDIDDTANTGPWGEEHLKYRKRLAHFINCNSDLSLSRFQLHKSCTLEFESIISEIMRFKIECLIQDSFSASISDFCTDVVIHKKNGKVHFKRMSLGEKKICKSFSELLNFMHALKLSSMEDWPRLLLMDELENHVYYDRHVSFVDCLKKVFKKQQIFATTHSGVLVPKYKNNDYDKDTECWFDLEDIID